MGEPSPSAPFVSSVSLFFGARYQALGRNRQASAVAHLACARIALRAPLSLQLAFDAFRGRVTCRAVVNDRNASPAVYAGSVTRRVCHN